jgi:hypothetical protein
MVWLQQADPSGQPGLGKGPKRPTAVQQKLGTGGIVTVLGS